MIYKATSLIAEEFENMGLKFRTTEMMELSMVEAGFNINAGPACVVRFISGDNENDVWVRVYGLLNNVPVEKRAAMLRVCNSINTKTRHFKFSLDIEDGDVIVEADLPISVEDSCVGAVCLEMFIRCQKILNEEFHLFTEALCGVGGPEDRRFELLRALKELSEYPITVNNDES